MNNQQCDEFLFIINREMCMYDDLSRNDKYKRDREAAHQRWKALEDIRDEFKKILERGE